MSGHILYEGPSTLDGKPIVLIAIDRSTNRKTGDMIQTYILRSDIHPVEAVKTKEDSSICGDCRHRGTTCYVNIAYGPSQVYKAYKARKYQVGEISPFKSIRIGTYGDPAAVPKHIWQNIMQTTPKHTGYTHQWRFKRFQYLQQWCMASVDSLEEQQQANILGWRTFRVTGEQEDVSYKLLLCPASELAGKVVQCQDCLACGGQTSQNRANVYIPVHGGKGKERLFNIERGKP